MVLGYEYYWFLVPIAMVVLSVIQLWQIRRLNIENVDDSTTIDESEENDADPDLTDELNDMTIADLEQAKHEAQQRCEQLDKKLQSLR